eukprot:CAMPEP_0114144660 /NCGR_PEP_ID=MMETSP0043_2-20121206/19643_1 /TAXON_ID=464988 /ORGANISM="Hemiselmis andersenii, Strain CCMP644" /LENGTH=356 /DNA_ID=CAMNT_0001239049 /DNA_START=108 /DNA_END=1175 /DNA_ORIENTATION=-
MFCSTVLSSDTGGYVPWTLMNQGGWSHSWYLTKGRRPNQEDTMDIVHHNGTHIFGVFDGHNGWMCSRRLQENFCKELMGKVAPLNLANRQQVEQVLRQEILRFEATFKEEAGQKNRPDGSTLNLCVIKGKNLVCANVGDSRSVLVRKGQASKLSEDHKPTNPAEAKRVEAAGGFIERNTDKAWRVNGIISVSRSLGDFNLKARKPGLICEPEFKHHNITEGDEYLVIGTDGLWDGLSIEDVAYTTTQKAGPGCAKALVQASLSRGSTDNTAVIVVDLRGAFTDGPPPQGPGAASQAVSGFVRYASRSCFFQCLHPLRARASAWEGGGGGVPRRVCPNNPRGCLLVCRKRLCCACVR